jgi:hypothetical protein
MCAHTTQTQKVETLEEQYKVKLSDESQCELLDETSYHIIGFTYSQSLIIP